MNPKVWAKITEKIVKAKGDEHPEEDNSTENHSTSMAKIILDAIGGFHCHTIIKTIQQIKSRIKEINEDEYSNSLAKVQVCAMFREHIQRNVLLTFIRLCMETPCLCPSEGHKCWLEVDKNICC